MTGVDMRERVLAVDVADSYTEESGRSRRWKSAALGGASAEVSCRVLRRRNQSITAFALPEGVGLTGEACCCQLASRSVLKRLSELVGGG
jgi:hypothetical protein